jgi:hypothetical protein
MPFLSFPIQNNLSSFSEWFLYFMIKRFSKRTANEPPRRRGANKFAAGYLVSVASSTRLDRVRKFIIPSGLIPNLCRRRKFAAGIKPDFANKIMVRCSPGRGASFQLKIYHCAWSQRGSCGGALADNVAVSV